MITKSLTCDNILKKFENSQLIESLKMCCPINFEIEANKVLMNVIKIGSKVSDPSDDRQHKSHRDEVLLDHS